MLKFPFTIAGNSIKFTQTNKRIKRMYKQQSLAKCFCQIENKI